MKKIILLAIIATIGFSACKKDGPAQSSSTADVTISNVKTSFTSLKYIDVTYSGITTFTINNYGSEVTTNTITIVLTNPAVGNIDFSVLNYLRLAIGSKIYTSKNGSGSYAITKKEATSISGTFTGTFTDETNATATISGNFSAVQFSLFK